MWCGPALNHAILCMLQSFEVECAVCPQYIAGLSPCKCRKVTLLSIFYSCAQYATKKHTLLLGMVFAYLPRTMFLLAPSKQLMQSKLITMHNETLYLCLALPSNQLKTGSPEMLPSSSVLLLHTSLLLLLLLLALGLYDIS
jgi:hypothetical protein